MAIGRLHWIIYGYALGVLFLSIILFSMGSSTRDSWPGLSFVIWIAAFVFLAAGLIIGARAWFDQWSTEIAVTNRRVIVKRGLIKRRTAEMNMDKIESVTVTQSIVGRLLNYGTVHIRGTGEGLEQLHGISAPVELRNCITAR